eukprot:100930-Chlamydomonas_euryale.AAC.3
MRDEHRLGGPHFGRTGRELRLGGPACGRGPSAGPTLARCRAPLGRLPQGLTWASLGSRGATPMPAWPA